MNLKKQLLRIARENPRLARHVTPVVNAISKSAGGGAGVKFFFDRAYIDLDTRHYLVKFDPENIRQPSLLNNMAQVNQILELISDEIDRIGGFRASVEDVRLESYGDSAEVSDAGNLVDIEIHWSQLSEELKWLLREDGDTDQDEVCGFSLESVSLENLVYSAGWSRSGLNPGSFVEVEGTAEFSILDYSGNFLHGGEMNISAHLEVSEELAYAYQDLDALDEDDDDDSDW